MLENSNQEFHFNILSESSQSEETLKVKTLFQQISCFSVFFSQYGE